MTFEYAGVTHPATGGIGNCVARLCPALAGLGHEVEVLTLDPEVTCVTVASDVEIHRVRHPRYRNSAEAIIGELRWQRTVQHRLARRRDLDLVIAPDWGGQANLLAGGQRCVPVLTQLHSSGVQVKPFTEPASLPSKVAARFKDFSEARQIVASDAVAGVSTNVLADARARINLSGHDSFVLHNFVDIEAIRRAGARDSTHILQPGRIVLFFGSLARRKGVDVLAHAMRQVVWPRAEDVQLVLAGDPPFGRYRETEAMLREIVGPYWANVRQLGQVTHTELFPLITRADVVALPSLWEALPFSVLEAMALGRPVVAAAGADDLIEHGRSGLVVPPENAEVLGRAIAELLDDRPLRDRIAHEASIRAKQFDVGVGAQRASDEFQRVTSEWRERSRAAGVNDRRPALRSRVRRVAEAPPASPDHDRASVSGVDRAAMRHFPNSQWAHAVRRAELGRAWRVETRSRSEFILDHARGQRVLDLGCVDHSTQGMDNPEWLHRQILGVASSCVGADYELEGIERMRAAGLTAWFVDVTKSPTPELRDAGPFDLIVAGELIEHLGSPQSLLEFARELLAPGGRLLITTPNPYAPWRVRSGQLRLFWESVDHTTYLFPSGIAEMANRSGMSLLVCTTVDRRDPRAVVKQSIRSALGAAARRVVGRSAPASRGYVDRVGRFGLQLGWGYLGPAEAMLHWARAGYGQLGETSIYLLERAKCACQHPEEDAK